MKPIVYIQHTPGQPMHEHCLAAWKGFAWNHYQVELVEPGLAIYTTPLDPVRPFVGSVEETLWNIEGRKQAYKAPPPLNIPDELLPFANRPIVRMTLEKALECAHLPFFIKPADTCKLWTAGVVTSKFAKLLFADHPPETPVLVSPAVDFASEYRVFVNRNTGIADMKNYSGDQFIVPDRKVVEEMMSAYTQAPRCYSLDVAVTPEGKTVIVECNDFWALGTYGMDPRVYSEMLALRWHELVTNLN